MQCVSIVWCGVAAATALFIGCRPAPPEVSDIEVDVTFDPAPPRIGSADVSLTLADKNGAPVKAATVRLEASMNHAGMKPSFADLEEVEPGRYSGTLEFTMGGDWFILVTVKTSHGETVERKVDVFGVEPR